MHLSPDQIYISILESSSEETVDSHEAYVRLDLGKRRFLVVLRPSDDLPSPNDMIVVLADLFRPGWDVEARLLPTPILCDGTLYRGFSLERRPSQTFFDYGGWKLDCLVPSPVEEEFDWTATAEALDAFHATIFFD